MIIRGRRPDQSYTVLANEMLRDQRLSWKARGLLAYVLSMHDDWRATSTHLARMAPDGMHSVRAALTELEAAGYLVRHRSQGRDGKWRTDVIIHETRLLAQDRPSPMSGFPTSENRAS